MKIERIQTFQRVDELSQVLLERMVLTSRFNLEIPHQEAVMAITGALKAVVEQRRHKLILDDATVGHIAEVARWLTDPNGKPSLLIGGGCGNGKTSMALALKQLVEFVTEYELGYDKRARMGMYSAQQICHLCSASERNREAMQEYDSLFSRRMLIIDDLGEEPKELLIYGMVHTPVIDLLSQRYQNNQLTIITSNLQAADIESRYGRRIRDRLREMAHTVVFANESYRR